MSISIVAIQLCQPRAQHAVPHPKTKHTFSGVPRHLDANFDTKQTQISKHFYPNPKPNQPLPNFYGLAFSCGHNSHPKTLPLAYHRSTSPPSWTNPELAGTTYGTDAGAFTGHIFSFNTANLPIILPGPTIAPTFPSKTYTWSKDADTHPNYGLRWPYDTCGAHSPHYGNCATLNNTKPTKMIPLPPHASNSKFEQSTTPPMSSLQLTEKSSNATL